MVRVDWPPPECQDSAFPIRILLSREMIDYSFSWQWVWCCVWSEYASLRMLCFIMSVNAFLHFYLNCFSSSLLKKIPIGEPAATLCLILPLWQHSWVDLFMIVLDFLSVCQLEEQLSRLQREKNDLQSRMEEDQEDLNELMKKHKAAVAQVGLFHTQTLCVH